MIGIISDIHGNNTALRAVIDELERIGVERIICLGDVAGYYCQVNECCETLRVRNIFTLMGNHDWYLTTGESCNRSTSANRCLEYQRGIISSENMNWLSGLNPKAQIEGLNIVHGGWNDPLEEYVTPSREYFSKRTGTHFSSGHTHVPCIWSDEDKSYCNPGSVGQPRDGIPSSSFAIFDDKKFSLHRVEYDYSSVQNDMKKAGFEEYYYENLESGTRIGGRIDSL